MSLRKIVLRLDTLAAGLVTALTLRRRSVTAMFVAYSVVAFAGIGLLTKLSIHGAGGECHRFVTVALLLTPCFGVYFATRPRFATSRGVGTLTIMAVALAVMLPAFSAAEWLLGNRDFVCRSGVDNHASLDCRTAMGSRPGETPQVAYVEPALWYPFAGCRPLNVPGAQKDHGGHDIFTGYPQMGAGSLDALGAWRGPGQPLPAYCSVHSSDSVCAGLLARPGACARETDSVQRCLLPVAGRVSP